MKIGVIGNMNNSYFSLTRYLRDEGMDCELLILADEPAHFDPGCDTFSTDYMTYCRHVRWGDPGDFTKQDFAEVESDLAPYDFLIGNGPAPAYVAKIGRRLDVFMPYGYDLYSLPFVRLVHPLRMLAYNTVRKYQRKGIRQSSYLLFDRTNEAFEKLIGKLRYTGERIVSPAPMIYHKDYTPGWQLSSGSGSFRQELQQLRTDNEILVVQHTRQIWKNSGDQWSFKGNDMLIHGFARFVKSQPNLPIKLVLFEYGNDVAETKKLIIELGLNSYVKWMPKMPRNQLMAVLAASDLVVGELCYSWLTYGVALEALCLGKPFMHKRIDAEFAADYPDLYPMVHAQSADTVYNGLCSLYFEKESMKAIGSGGQQWFLTYCVQQPVNIIQNIIRQKAAVAYD